MSNVAAPTPTAVVPAARGRLRRKHDLLLYGCSAVIVLAALAAVIGPLVAPYGANAIDALAPLQGPSAQHLLGTDELGRDILSRLLYGAQASLLGPAIVVIISATAGSFVGIFSAWVGGGIDATISRALDILFALPSLILAILAVAMFGEGLAAPVSALCIAYVPYLARVTRAATLRERQLPYVEALWAQGISGWKICARHILHSVFPLIVVQAALSYGYAMTDLAAISFIGLGQQPPATDWGSMVADGQSSILQGSPEQSLFASLVIVLVVLSFTVLGDRLARRWAVST